MAGGFFSKVPNPATNSTRPSKPSSDIKIRKVNKQQGKVSKGKIQNTKVQAINTVTDTWRNHDEGLGTMMKTLAKLKRTVPVDKGLSNSILTPMIGTTEESTDQTNGGEKRSTKTGNRDSLGADTIQSESEPSGVEQMKEIGILHNYPMTLDKQYLESSATNYLEDMVSLLKGQIESEYSTKAETFIKKQKKITSLILASAELEVPTGYFGAQGQQIMAMQLQKLLNDKIIHQGRTKTWISKFPVLLYIQSVLVPELSIRIIMAERDVDRGEAQNILLDSTNYGEIMFPYEADNLSESDQSDYYISDGE